MIETILLFNSIGIIANSVAIILIGLVLCIRLRA